VRVPDRDLPSSDRIAHLLLALREDEQGFATVANHAFSGARWRVRRRLEKPMRAALAAAARAEGERGALQASTRRFHALVQHASEAVIVLDADGLVVEYPRVFTRVWPGR
jgi:PAS domain-containing protein